MPKPAAAPKLASVHITPVRNGVKVQHHMTHGPQPRPFVFQDPAKAIQHVRKIQANQWRMPESNPAASMDRTLDLNTL